MPTDHNPFAPHDASDEEVQPSEVEDSETETETETETDDSDNAPETDLTEGSARDVLDRVDGDKEKAKAALDAETAKDKPRKSLVAALTEIVED